MAKNFPGPYEIELFYAVSSRVHTQRLNCDFVVAPTPGTPPTSINFKTRGGVASPDVQTGVTSWVTLVRPIFNVGMTFDSFNVYAYTPLSTVKKFITSGTIALPGTSATATNLSHQITLTFRTVDGDGMRIVFLESTLNSIIRNSYATLPANQKVIMDFVDSDLNWILARDTSYAISKVNGVGGENEAVFKARNR